VKLGKVEALPKWAQRDIEGLERRIERAGQIDLMPGAVNEITLTRRDRTMMRYVADQQVLGWVKRL